MGKLSTAAEYVDWRGDLSFEASPLNEVDLLLLSQIVTPDYRDIVTEDGPSVALCDVAEAFFATHADTVDTLGVLQSPELLPALRAAAKTERFGGLRLSAYVNLVSTVLNEQFAALTIILPNGNICVSFRGTDDTIVGWREDLNLAICEGVPAQLDAVRYLERAAAKYPDAGIYIVGHSKGGNLAVYAGVHAKLCGGNARILAIRSYDGPGFRGDTLKAGALEMLGGRIKTYMPEYSVVGTLFSPVGEVCVVSGNETGPMSHDPFTWGVLGRELLFANKLSDVSVRFSEVLCDTLSGMTTEEQIAFCDEMFDSIMDFGIVTIAEFSKLGLTKQLELLLHVATRSSVRRFNRGLVDNLISQIREIILGMQPELHIELPEALKKEHLNEHLSELQNELLSQLHKVLHA